MLSFIRSFSAPAGVVPTLGPNPFDGVSNLHPPPISRVALKGVNLKPDSRTVEAPGEEMCAGERSRIPLSVATATRRQSLLCVCSGGRLFCDYHSIIYGRPILRIIWRGRSTGKAWCPGTRTPWGWRDGGSGFLLGPEQVTQVLLFDSRTTYMDYLVTLSLLTSRMVRRRAGMRPYRDPA